MSRWHLSTWILSGSVLWGLGCVQSSTAQVVPDNTLPAGERSQVTGNPNFQIDGGARRGGNLFHSFQQFSVPTGGSAYFNNAADIQNILTRVTGGSISNIDGLIRANGTANLFLLNPNGIIFGANAQLNVGGSFIATTADAIGLANGDIFSANPRQPLPSQLLNINPNAFFFNQLAAQSIVNRSTANNGTGLQVPAGQSLLLVGGDVGLEGGQIVSPGSRVELGAVAGQGTVGLSGTAGDWRLSFPDNVARADASLSNSALIDVRAGGGGSIAVTARNVTLNQGSRLRAGINDGLGFAGAQAGDVQLNATEAINLGDGSQIRNEVRPGGTGKAGNINITTGSLASTGGSYIVDRTDGQGDAGSMNINARDTVSLDGYGTTVENSVRSTGVGNAGGINITTGSLFLTNTAQLSSFTLGQGNVSSVNINARDTVALDGRDSSGYVTGIFNTVGQTGVGNTGGINITTGALSLTGGAQLQSATFGQGNTGNVNINARDTVTLDGDGSNVFNVVTSTGVGNSGNINITTGSLSLTNAAQLTSYTEGQGNAGSVDINARNTVSFDGTYNGDYSSVFSTVFPTAIGNGGGINITAGSLSLTNGAQLVSNMEGQGNAGSVNINVRDTVTLDDSNVFTNVKNTGVGNGGSINITTGSLSLINGAQLQSATLGRGNAGSVNINARDTVSLDGYQDSSIGAFTSTIFTTVNPGAIGQGGDVNITTGSLFLTNGGSVTTANIGGIGNSGRVTINARDSVQIRGTAPNFQSEVTTLVRPGAVGNGGDVIITTGSLLISDQGDIATAVQGRGNAGNIQIQARDSVSFDGGNAISTLEQGGVGRGGDINITTGSLSLLNGAQLEAFTSGEGNAGNITVSADTVGLSGGGQLLTTTSSSGRAGDITINTPSLQLLGTTTGLFAGTTSAGDAGNLTIQPLGNGQSVRVNLQGGAQISASTSSRGNGGRLTITAPDSITLTGNGSVIAAGTGGGGAGGNLTLTTDTLNIQNQAQVSVSSQGTGTAGSLFVDANQIYLDNQGSIRADTTGGGGDINLRSPLILLRNGSSITTNARGINIPGGNISINTDNLVAVPSENSDISANSEDFRGGKVTIRASGIFGIEFREQPTALSDITATGVSSQFNGTVDLITPGIDPSRGLAELPTEVVDATDAIAQGCRDVQGSSFVVTGRGGLPPTPEQSLGDDPRWRDWRTPVGVSRQPNASRQETLPSLAKLRSTKSALVEATGWVIEPDGKVILTATAPHVTSPNRWEQHVNCDRS